MARHVIPLVLALGLVGSACTSMPAAPPTGTGSPGPSSPTTAPPLSPHPSHTANAPDPQAAIELARADVARADADPARAVDAAAAINAFGFDLLPLVGQPDVNLVFSPASIQLALGMTRPGARGETGTQMDRVMHDLGSDAMADAVNALDQALIDRSGSFRDGSGNVNELMLRVINAPFAQRGYPFEQAYLDTIGERYGAGVHLVDYINDTEAARQAINGWVAEQTEDRIPELLSEDELDPMSRLTLVNAIYLKAPWLVPFGDLATADERFTRPDGTSVSVPMMHVQTAMPYAEGRGWRAAEIPYAGGALAMTVILPEDLATFEADLDADGFGRIVDSLCDTGLKLSMPRFDIETREGLNDMLTTLGMPLAFDPVRADFSGITTAEQLYIDFVIHQANITVDELGTEAAAATAVGVLEASGLRASERLVLDRPFLFAVRDVPTGAILFMGRITDPSQTRQ